MTRIVCHYCPNPAKWRCDEEDCNAPLCNRHRYVVASLATKNDALTVTDTRDACYRPHQTDHPPCCACIAVKALDRDVSGFHTLAP